MKRERTPSASAERSGHEPERLPGRSARRLVHVAIAVVFLSALYPRHSFVEYRNVNEQARLYLVKAAVEEGVLFMNTGIAKYGDLQDKAMRGEHSYCDKPVGLSVLAVPVYGILYHAGRVFGHEWSIQGMRYALTVACVTLPSILLLFLLERYWAGLGAAPWLVALGILAYGLGTIAFTYSTQFVGHQLAAVVAFAHFFLSRSFSGRVAGWKLLAAGALAGFGAITDHFSAFVHLAIFLSYATKVRPLSSFFPFALGGAVAFSPLPLYNLLAFGGMTRMSYGQEALPVFKELHGTGFYGVTLPRLDSITGLLASPAKGLFWISPFLLLGIVGLAAAVRDRERRRDGIVMAAAVGMIVWLACSVVDWIAGWTVGPRHMVSMLPFLATGAVYAVRRIPRLAGAFTVGAAVSMVLVFVPTMTLPAYEVNFVRPFASQAIFLLREGLVSPNPGQALGIPGAWSLLPPALLVAMIFAYVLLRTPLSIAGINPRTLVLPSAALVVAALLVGSFYPRGPEPVEMYYQARVLKLVDAPRLAAARFEQTVERCADPSIRRQVAERAYPEAAAIYAKLSDSASLGRVAASWARINPESPKLHQLTGSTP